MRRPLAVLVIAALACIALAGNAVADTDTKAGVGARAELGSRSSATATKSACKQKKGKKQAKTNAKVACATTITVKKFAPNFKIALGAKWTLDHSIDDQPNMVQFVDGQDTTGSLAGYATFAVPLLIPTSTPATPTEALRQYANRLQPTPAVATTVGGLPAQRFDVTGPNFDEETVVQVAPPPTTLPPTSSGAPVAVTEGPSIAVKAGNKGRVYVVDVSGQTLVIVVDVPAADFDHFTTAVDALLATVKF